MQCSPRYLFFRASFWSRHDDNLLAFQLPLHVRAAAEVGPLILLHQTNVFLLKVKLKSFVLTPDFDTTQPPQWVVLTLDAN